MNPNTLVSVHAYSGDQHQVENNMDLYRHHGCPVVIVSPADSPITSVRNQAPDVHCVWAGRAGWIGPQTLERQRLHFEELLKFPHQNYLMHDADSICLSPRISDYLYREPGVLWSNEVTDTNPGPSYLPKLALQPPYFCSRQVLEAMLAAAKTPAVSYYGPPVNPGGWPMPFPTECIDHWMLQVAHATRFPHKSFLDGASFETASPHGIETMSGLVRHHGRIFLHSVKTLPVLDRLRVEHEAFCKTHR